MQILVLKIEELKLNYFNVVNYCKYINIVLDIMLLKEI
jgi:hypothetical protein